MATIDWIAHNTGDIIRRAIWAYFAPLFEAVTNRAIELPLSQQVGAASARVTDKSKTISVIRSAVCFNQGTFIEYSLLSAERHKALRKAIDSSVPDREHIQTLAGELINYLNMEFHKSTFENFKLLHGYFAGRHKVDPRICVKGAFRSDQKDTIVSVFRDRKVQYLSDAEVSTNSGFFSIVQTGQYFLLNDIPEAARRGNYQNSRLDPRRVKQLYATRRKEGSASTALDTPKSWKECWIDYEPGISDETPFYKSTLIVPMTLWNNELSDEFKTLAKFQKLGRTVLGFLCFDHTDTEYFNDEDDVSIGYIFADLLSIYLFVRLVYTEISETFAKAESYIEKDELLFKLEQLDLSWEKARIGAKHDRTQWALPRKTSNNKLFAIDEVLRDYGRRESSRKPS